MTHALRQSIYRERRRLLLVTVLAFLAGVIFYLRADHYINGVHVALVTGAVYAVIIGPVALLVCVFLPSLRFMVEAVAISRLLFAIFVFAAPGIGYGILASPSLTALIVVGGGAVISRVVHGRILREKARGWRDHILPRNAFQRHPVRLSGTVFQHRFVGWLEDAIPVRA